MTEDLQGLGVAPMFKPNQTCYLIAVEQTCSRFKNMEQVGKLKLMYVYNVFKYFYYLSF